MRRLAFRLPEWAPRVSWVSEEARAVWEPRFSRVSNAWVETERDLVEAGIRPSALQNVSPEALPALMQAEALRGLIVLPLSQVARVQGYQSASLQLQPGAAFDYRCAVTRQVHAAEWATAWSKSDDSAIGKLLGYPECCRKFFQQFWIQERWMDTTWPMAEAPEGANMIEVLTEGVNLLWRWHGIRAVSHLPCSFHCWDSRSLQKAALDVMPLKFPDEAKWMREILSWPVEWSALHGIAEIRTPITRTSVATDATADKLTVRYLGKGYPAEGAQGMGFPHRTVKPLVMSNSKDNGFSSHAAMTDAHNALLNLLKGPYKTVLDLGCGDGLLLSKVLANRRIGIEQNERVAKLAERRLDRVVVGDVTDQKLVAQVIAEEQPDLVIAQQDRNPLGTLIMSGAAILSYTYEGKTEAILV